MRLIVIGGGAAGFFCAVNAARMNPALETIIIEKTGKLLSKLRISGGGRCNVTHACFSIEDMSRHYPRGANFVKKAFHQFFTADTIAWFKERGVMLKTEADGRMFPVSDDSSTIVNCFLQEADKYGVAIWMNREVREINKTGSQWEIVLANGECHQADKICIACGGYPKAPMFDWIRRLGHSVEPPVPSLFTFNVPGNPLTQLMGITVPRATVKIQGTRLEETGPALITHWGLSGPAILRLSARGARLLAERQYQFGITVNWASPLNEQLLRQQFQDFRQKIAAQKIRSRNNLGIPHRLWEYLCEQSGIGADMRWGDLPSAKQNALLKNTCSQEIRVSGKTTFKEEFVTAGGVELAEVDPNTMESKRHPSLFFAGEIMDTDGVTGGFNFQHAWTSGWIAARAIASGAY